MKPTKYIACLTFLFTTVMVCRSQNLEKVTVQSDMGSGIFNLVYKTKSTVPGTVQVSILDSNGKTVFTESIIKTLSFARPYNFNDQSTGDFTLVVEDKEGKIEKKITYSIKKVESMIEVSKIANASDKYMLRIVNHDDDQIHVKILDSDKNVLHEESITVNGKYAVVYNLRKFKTSPTFEVSGSNGVLKTFSF